MPLVTARDLQLVGGHSSQSKQLFVALAAAEVVARLSPSIGPERVPGR